MRRAPRASPAGRRRRGVPSYLARAAKRLGVPCLRHEWAVESLLGEARTHQGVQGALRGSFFYVDYSRSSHGVGGVEASRVFPPRLRRLPRARAIDRSRVIGRLALHGRRRRRAHALSKRRGGGEARGDGGGGGGEQRPRRRRRRRLETTSETFRRPPSSFARRRSSMPCGLLERRFLLPRRPRPRSNARPDVVPSPRRHRRPGRRRRLRVGASSLFFLRRRFGPPAASASSPASASAPPPRRTPRIALRA